MSPTYFGDSLPPPTAVYTNLILCVILFLVETQLNIATTTGPMTFFILSHSLHLYHWFRFRIASCDGWFSIGGGDGGGRVYRKARPKDVHHSRSMEFPGGFRDRGVERWTKGTWTSEFIATVQRRCVTHLAIGLSQI